ncbi:MAG: type II secretion system protein [Clostridia bacterium]|nr:type II secretion system protein [Clostridia bacterium]
MKRRAPEKNKKRGFTVAEVIIALTVIVTVSAAALVMISMQVRTETKAAQTIAATNMAENAIECFRYSYHSDTKEFEQAFTECGYEKKAENLYTHGTLLCEIAIAGNEIDVTVRNARGETVASVENFLVGE